MASTTYRHIGDLTDMFAVQEQFRDITKMVCARLRGLTKHTILPSLAIWCATPDSCRSLSGLVLPVAAARVVLPAALQGLDRQQMTAPSPGIALGEGRCCVKRENERYKILTQKQ